MQVLSYDDYRINFIPDAFYEVMYRSVKVEVPTSIEGMKLVIGKNMNRYNILLMNGDDAIAVVQLIHRHEYTPEGLMICEPHSYTQKDHRGKAYAEQIYRWILDNNIVLRSCDHQTQASHNLWKKLGKKYTLKFFDSIGKGYKSVKDLYHMNVLMELSKN